MTLLVGECVIDLVTGNYYTIEEIKGEKYKIKHDSKGMKNTQIRQRDEIKSVNHLQGENKRVYKPQGGKENGIP
jgi:hypothetical protein